MALIETDPTDPLLEPMLRQYAPLWFCYLHRDPAQAIVQNLVKRWEGELKQAFAAERICQQIKPRLQWDPVIPGSFLDDDCDNSVDDVYVGDVSVQGFTMSGLSPLFTPLPQGYPMMPGHFLYDEDDDVDVDDDDGRVIQGNHFQAINEVSRMDDAVSAPATPASANTNDKHRRPSSRRKRSVQAHPTARWQFIPYNLRSADDFLHTTIISQLKESELSSGYIYILQRPDDTEYFKIGYTTQDPDFRLEEWRRSCLSPYIRLYATEQIANVKRVESLIHADLRPVRYSESRCKHNLDCRVQHTEWFKVSFDKAKAAVDHWARWMTALEPYENGFLKAKYVLQMFREDEDAGFDGDGISALFLNDSDGNSWVEHAQVLKDSKKDDTPTASPPNQNSMDSMRNQGRQPPPCAPTLTPVESSSPPCLGSDSRTSSSSTASSLFSIVSTSSSASEITVTAARIGSDRLSSKPTRRRIFHPKDRSLPSKSPGDERDDSNVLPGAYSPGYDVKVGVNDPPTPSRPHSHSEKRRYPDVQSLNSKGTPRSSEQPTPRRGPILPAREKDRLISFAMASATSRGIPALKRPSTASVAGTCPAPAPSPSQPDLLTLKARELAAGGRPHCRAVSSPAILVQHSHHEHQHNVVENDLQSVYTNDKEPRDNAVDVHNREDESTGSHPISSTDLSESNASHSADGEIESDSDDMDTNDDEEDGVINGKSCSDIASDSEGDSDERSTGEDGMDTNDEDEPSYEGYDSNGDDSADDGDNECDDE
ncbi:uncharacterized protein A1O9_10372 [Exophiala aquamarina CBS 119918]|uniref:Bacteriophage T5 Orf172 DNA-binding domain-containing protein n=1 Tax=Exophiala aquamarina CBS 119918 TaxID=1182545 RepID=A0A072P149_9EURO|nr:uncharacterized protein A1O9_10372 [Exophiala aquamarina CBS 119918]KEF53397.1 hypothetical protein A1O9_10372 [Exophiala aquamarina CBS 119918]